MSLSGPDPSSKSALSKIPHLHEEMSKIKAFLIEHSVLAVIVIDTTRIVKIESDYGKRVFADVFERLAELVIDMKGRVIRLEDIVAINYAEGMEYFLVFLSKKRKGAIIRIEELEVMAQRINDHVNFALFPSIYPLLKTPPRVQIGYAQVIYNPLIKEERLIYNLIEEAKVTAEHRAYHQLAKNKETLQELIVTEGIATIFQPIVSLKDRQVLGYEALSRGPAGSAYENPYFLFNIAREVNLTFELDRVCRYKALINSRNLKQDLYLFINCLPTTVHDPEFKGERLNTFLEGVRLSPMRIVLEISEHDAIENFEIFREAMRYYSDIGFAIAIDDTGAGYSSLEAVVELRPNFLKLDISLIRKIPTNALKQELVRGLINLAGRMNSRVIAEGIETQEELDTLLELGVPLGQGYLIAQPSGDFADFKPIEIDGGPVGEPL